MINRNLLEARTCGDCLLSPEPSQWPCVANKEARWLLENDCGFYRELSTVRPPTHAAVSNLALLTVQLVQVTGVSPHSSGP